LEEHQHQQQSDWRQCVSDTTSSLFALGHQIAYLLAGLFEPEGSQQNEASEKPAATNAGT
jgi:hypothetical protein